MQNKIAFKLAAFLAAVCNLAGKLPESSVAVCKHAMSLVKAGRSMGAKLRAVKMSFAGSAWGQRWKAGRGQSVVVGIVGLFLMAIFAAYLIGPSITFIFGVATTTWSAGTAALWAVVGLVIALGVIILVIKTTGMM